MENGTNQGEFSPAQDKAEKRKKMPKKYLQSHRIGEKALTAEQAEKLQNSIDNLQDRAMVSLALSNGIRREDMAALKWANIDLEHATIAYIEKKKGGRIWSAPIPSEKTVGILKMWKKQNKNEWVFPASWSKTGHMTGRTLYNRFHTQLIKAGIEPKPFHALRATCVKLCQKNGWTVEQTARLIGDTVAVVQEHYATPSSEELMQAARQKPIL